VLGYDSDNLDDIPDSIASDPNIVLNYYADGEPGTASSSQLARFATAHRYSITRNLTHPAYWGDVEPGCLWPLSQGVDVLRSGLVKGLYISLSNWPQLRSSIFVAQLPPPPYWVAQYPFTTPTNPAVDPSWVALGCVQWQFADPPNSGGHYDLSVTAPGWPPPPVVLPRNEDEVIFGTDADGRPFIAYPARGTNAPTILTQTAKADATHPFGVWEGGDMTNPIVTVNNYCPPVVT